MPGDTNFSRPTRLQTSGGESTRTPLLDNSINVTNQANSSRSSSLSGSASGRAAFRTFVDIRLRSLGLALNQQNQLDMGEDLRLRQLDQGGTADRLANMRGWNSTGSQPEFNRTDLKNTMGSFKPDQMKFLFNARKEQVSLKIEAGIRFILDSSEGQEYKKLYTKNRSSGGNVDIELGLLNNPNSLGVLLRADRDTTLHGSDCDKIFDAYRDKFDKLNNLLPEALNGGGNNRANRDLENLVRKYIDEAEQAQIALLDLWDDLDQLASTGVSNLRAIMVGVMAQVRQEDNQRTAKDSRWLQKVGTRTTMVFAGTGLGATILFGILVRVLTKT